MGYRYAPFVAGWWRGLPHNRLQYLKSVVDLLRSVAANRYTIWQMTKREVVGRYRGSALGLVWSLITPLIMLVVYTFVFSVVFKARWGISSEESQADYAVLLFCGLILFNFFSECANRAPMLIASTVIYVKKIVFPLEIFAIVAALSALFHMLVSLGVLLAVELVLFHGLPWTIILFPLLLVPLLLATLGVSWVLAVIGVYLRDIIPVVALGTSVLMFASPLFFPISALPGRVQTLLWLNPFTFLFESARDVLVFGRVPDPLILAGFWIGGALIALLGFRWFQHARQGFADVV
jgi:lipopolysaccharide transport system permease protein